MRTDNYWWCPNCKEEIEPHNVTYQEIHELCGRRVQWIENILLARIEEIFAAERDGRLVVLAEKPLPLVAKPDCTDAFCPYCDEDVSGLWGVADYVPDICQCPECGEFIDVCAPTITREEAEAALKKKEEL